MDFLEIRTPLYSKITTVELLKFKNYINMIYYLYSNSSVAPVKFLIGASPRSHVAFSFTRVSSNLEQFLKPCLSWPWHFWRMKVTHFIWCSLNWVYLRLPYDQAQLTLFFVFSFLGQEYHRCDMVSFSLTSRTWCWLVLLPMSLISVIWLRWYPPGNSMLSSLFPSLQLSNLWGDTMRLYKYPLSHRTLTYWF